MLEPLVLLFLMADTTPPPETDLYDRARANMVEILARQSNYICIETIDRAERMKSRSKFDVVDSLRFEVAFLGKHELYAWPGSKKFDETNILDLVPEGSAIGTGAFAGHAQLLFQTNAAIVNGGYWVTEGGKRQARFLFTVPLSRSHYLLLKSRKEGMVVAYSGDISIDPEAARVTRINLHGDDIPAKLEIEATKTVIEYGEVKIGEHSFWLPAQSIEEITTANGRTDRNVTQFSGCRAFSGESTLKFDEVPDIAPATPAPEPAKVVVLPPGIPFEIQFDAEIDSNKVHVGDPVPAMLASDIALQDKVLFAKGSAVEMRIVRVQRLGNWIGLEFATGDVTTPSATARLLAIVKQPVQARSKGAGGSPQVSSDAKRPGLGAVFVHGNHMLLKKGFRSTWVTVAPPKPKPPTPGQSAPLGSGK